MIPDDIMKGMAAKQRLLTDKNDNEYPELMEKRSVSERDYTQEFSKEILKQRADGIPITVIKEIVKGLPHVAKLKFEWDVAAGVEKACLNSMKILIAQIDSYRSLLSWEKQDV